MLQANEETTDSAVPHEATGNLGSGGRGLFYGAAWSTHSPLFNRE